MLRLRFRNQWNIWDWVLLSHESFGKNLWVGAECVSEDYLFFVSVKDTTKKITIAIIHSHLQVLHKVAVLYICFCLLIIYELQWHLYLYFLKISLYFWKALVDLNQISTAPKIFWNKFCKPTPKYPTNFSTSNFSSIPPFELSKSKYRISVRGTTLWKKVPTNSEKMKESVTTVNSIWKKRDFFLASFGFLDGCFWRYLWEFVSRTIF